MEVWPVFVAVAVIVALASYFVDARPWSFWGLPPRTPEDAERRYEREEMDGSLSTSITVAIAVAIGYPYFYAMEWLGFGGDPARSALVDWIDGFGFLATIWGAVFGARLIEHRYRLRSREVDEYGEIRPRQRTRSS